MVVHVSSSPLSRQPPTPSKSLSGPMLGSKPNAFSLIGVVVPAVDRALELLRWRRLFNDDSKAVDPAEGGVGLVYRAEEPGPSRVG